MIRFLAVLLLALQMGAAPAQPASPAESESARILRLSEKLRCLVCQNQSLADSNAELALDLRRELQAQVKAGRSDEEILAFMVARYGDFVLYRPPFKATTALLWLGPFLLFAGAAAVVLVTLRRRRTLREEPALDDEERRLVDQVLGDRRRDGQA